MDLMLNDLSIHEQFPHVSVFRESLQRIMQMRDVARRFGRELYTQRTDLYKLISSSTTLFEAIQQLSPDEKRSLLLWLQHRGPFWEDGFEHCTGDRFEYNGSRVTGTVLAEAAYCTETGLDRRLVSLTPSTWEFSPITVNWIRESSTVISVINYYDLSVLEAALEQAEPPIDSWLQLEDFARNRFQRLFFNPACFEDLEGRPFPRALLNVSLNASLSWTNL